MRRATKRAAVVSSSSSLFVSWATHHVERGPPAQANARTFVQMKDIGPDELDDAIGL